MGDFEVDFDFDFEGENKALQLGLFRKPRMECDLRCVSSSVWLSVSEAACELELDMTSLALLMGDDNVLLNPECVSSSVSVDSSGNGRVMEKRLVRDAEGGVIWIPDDDTHDAVNMDFRFDRGVAGDMVGEVGRSIAASSCLRSRSMKPDESQSLVFYGLRIWRTTSITVVDVVVSA